MSYAPSLMPHLNKSLFISYRSTLSFILNKAEKPGFLKKPGSSKPVSIIVVSYQEITKALLHRHY